MPNLMPFGTAVHDYITGFAGTITARAEYITGQKMYLVEADADETNEIKAEWIVAERLKVSAME